MALFSDKKWQDWVRDYSKSHENPINKAFHMVGIPIIVISLFCFVLALVIPGFLVLAIALFVIGWIFQFIGHIYEKKPPEFFKDWRFLFVGVRWWWQKVSHSLTRKYD